MQDIQKTECCAVCSGLVTSV